MGKQMTIGQRIALGFSVVILILLVLGGLGAYSMLSAKSDAVDLATERIPEIKVATDLRGAANRVMYQMRGYGMTEDSVYYEAAKKELGVVNTHLAEGADLSSRSDNLTTLEKQINESRGAVDSYADLMKQTDETIAAMAAQRTKLDENAARYMQNCAEFLKGQNAALKTDLDERQKKIQIVTDIVDRGTRARIQNFKAQRANDMNLLQQAVTLVRGVDEEMKQLRPITRQQVDIDQMDNVEAAAQKYAEAMEAYVEANAALVSAGDKMNTNAIAYMDNCTAYLASQNDKIKAEFGQDGANLQERMQKITWINDIINVGNAARITNFKAQAHQDPELMRSAIEQINSVKDVATQLRAITHQADNIRQIDTIETAAMTYGQAVQEYLNNYLKLEEIRKEMDNGAGAYVSNCESFLTNQQQALTKDMHERSEKIRLVNDIVNLANDARVKAFKAQALRTPAIMEEAIKNFEQLDQKYTALRTITRLDIDLQRIDNTKASGDNYAGALGTFLAQWHKLQDLGQQREAAGQKVIEACKTTADGGMDVAEKSVAALSTSSTIMIVTLAVGTAIAIFFAFWIARSIMGPLNRIIVALTRGAEQVAAASGQVSAASESLAEGATEQAAGLEETSSSLEEMSAMTKQNADNAQQANTLASEASKAADTGSQSMTRMNQAIEDIQRSSDETAKIIKVIDEIAFQTNLLALNAAVEAARAGEAGKGFAVVAEEVRNLAMRSAEAAKNTASMIEESVKSSKNGVDIAVEVGKVLDEIVQSIGRTTDLVSEIAAASQEQAQGIDQINTTVNEMDKVTQQNAANAEESASASEELSAQAQSVNDVVAELMTLVGGSRSRKGRHTEGKKGASASMTTSHVSGRVAKKVSKKQAFGRSDETLHRIAMSAEKEPQRVIPLGDDADLDHFNM